jgi:hypothetical protein
MQTSISYQFDINYRYGLEEIPFDITRQELLYFYSFDDREKIFIKKNCRLQSYQVTLGLLLGTYKFIGRPQILPENSPPTVIKFVAKALRLESDFPPLQYSDRKMTRWNYDQMARSFLGLNFFSPSEHPRLINHLIEISPEPDNVQDWIKKAEDFLRSRNYVLPSMKLLRRLLLSARRQKLDEIMHYIFEQIGNEKSEKLNCLLNSDERYSGWFELTNKNIYSTSAAKLSLVLERIKKIKEFSFHQLDLKNIPERYIRYFSQYGLRLSVKQLKDQSPVKRIAIMTATLKELETELTDIAVQMNDEILSGIFLRGERRSEAYFRKHRQTIQQVVSIFNHLTGVIIDNTMSPEEKIALIEKTISIAKLQELKEKTDKIHIPKGLEKLHFASEGYQSIQKYLPTLLETFTITSHSKKDPLLEAAEYYLKRKRDGKPGIGSDAPIDFIQEKKWKRIAFDPDGKLKTKPWIVCLADKLRKSFRQGSLEIEGTRQYRALNSDLIPWTEWKATKMENDAALPYTSSAEKAITPLFRSIQNLSGQYMQWIEKNSASIDEKNRLHFTKLDKVIEPDSVKELRHIIQNSMPPSTLPEILVEVDRMTGFSSYFSRLSTGQPIKPEQKMETLALYTNLLASACNIPIYKITTKPEVSIDLLENIHEDVIRPQTMHAAMVALVDFYSRLPLARIWNPGDTSSSDGQGFIAYGRPLGAVYNRKRLGRKSGFIIYTHLSGNFAPYFTQVLPAAVREAPYVLNGLLYHGTSLMPREHYTDSHGYTDVVFAIAYLLGFKLAPRLANMPNLTLWYGKGHDGVFCPTPRKGIFQRSIRQNVLDRNLS